MSIYLYDKAFVEKLQRWTANTDIHIYSPDESSRLFEVEADLTDDQPLKLPIIALSRTSSFEILNPNKKPLAFDGMMLDATEDMSSQLNAIPINISYQLDVYTRYLREADDYVRDLIFNIINHPTLKIEIPYNDINYTHFATLRVSNSVNNNSSIPERIISGQFTRLSLDVYIDDAYLWDSRYRNNIMVLEENDIVTD